MGTWPLLTGGPAPDTSAAHPMVTQLLRAWELHGFQYKLVRRLERWLSVVDTPSKRGTKDGFWRKVFLARNSSEVQGTPQKRFSGQYLSSLNKTTMSAHCISKPGFWEIQSFHSWRELGPIRCIPSSTVWIPTFSSPVATLRYSHVSSDSISKTPTGVSTGKPTGPIPPTAPATVISFWGSCFQQEQQLQHSFPHCMSHPSDTAPETTSLAQPLHSICIRNSQRLQTSSEAQWKWGSGSNAEFLLYWDTCRDYCNSKATKLGLSLDYFFQAESLSPALQLLHGVFSRLIYLPSLSPHLWSIFFKIPRHSPSVSESELCSWWTTSHFFIRTSGARQGRCLNVLSYSSDALISLICEETPGLSKHSRGFYQQIILQQEYAFLYFPILWHWWNKHFLTSGYRGEGIKNPL